MRAIVEITRSPAPVVVALALAATMGSLPATALASQQSSTDAIRVTVVKLGRGEGTVRSTPPGIDCGRVCQMDAEQSRQEIVFTATAAPGSVFVGWTAGGCSGDVPTCRYSVIPPLVQNANVIRAVFEPAAPAEQPPTDTGKSSSGATGQEKIVVRKGVRRSEATLEPADGTSAQGRPLRARLRVTIDPSARIAGQAYPIGWFLARSQGTRAGTRIGFVIPPTLARQDPPGRPICSRPMSCSPASRVATGVLLTAVGDPRLGLGSGSTLGRPGPRIPFTVFYGGRGSSGFGGARPDAVVDLVEYRLPGGRRTALVSSHGGPRAEIHVYLPPEAGALIIVGAEVTIDGARDGSAGLLATTGCPPGGYAFLWDVDAGGVPVTPGDVGGGIARAACP